MTLKERIEYHKTQTVSGSGTTHKERELNKTLVAIMEALERIEDNQNVIEDHEVNKEMERTK